MSNFLRELKEWRSPLFFGATPFQFFSHHGNKFSVKKTVCVFICILFFIVIEVILLFVYYYLQLSVLCNRVGPTEYQGLHQDLESGILNIGTPYMV